MDSFTIESLLREYVRLRKKVAEEHNYRLYPHYATDIKGSLCSPINAGKFLLAFFKNLSKKEYPEDYDFEFARETSDVFDRIYKEMHADKGLKISSIVLSRKDLIEARYILENIINRKSSYLSYLNLIIGVLIGFLISFLLPQSFPHIFNRVPASKADPLQFILELLLFIVVLFLFFSFLPFFATNIIFKKSIYKELLLIINRRLEEFELEEKSGNRDQGQNEGN